MHTIAVKGVNDQLAPPQLDPSHYARPLSIKKALSETPAVQNGAGTTHVSTYADEIIPVRRQLRARLAHIEPSAPPITCSSLC
jgi:hypothetical protein